MAHNLDMDKDGNARMFYLEEDGVPWHGLGTEVQEAPTAEEAIRLAGLDWKVHKEKIFTDHGKRVPARFATVRSDTGQVLGDVGSRYHVIQNEDAFGFADVLIGQGQAVYQTAGSLGDGEQVWMLADIGEALDMPAEDRVGRFLCLTNSHDGSRALEVLLTNVRVVCQNTLNVAISGSQKSMKIRHTENYRAKVQQAREVLGVADAYYEKFSEAAHELAGLEMLDKDAKEFLENLFPPPEEESPRAETLRDRYREEVFGLFSGDGAGLDRDGIRGTGWAMFNAVAEWADWQKTVRPGDSSELEARFKSNLFGSSARIKQKAFSELLSAT